ncbi:MAG TPA: helix-turn-helix transcriptional regulator [Candidatus Paceibacterota bacterium]|nr:helix-turn-helix transcriptional regulator [Candidatus Paceibacterota bacterium]
MPNPKSGKLAKIVKQLREQKKWSQEKLARVADVSNNTITNIEVGNQLNPTIDTLRKIAKALEVDAKDLMD